MKHKHSIKVVGLLNGDFSTVTFPKPGRKHEKPMQFKRNKPKKAHWFPYEGKEKKSATK